MLDKIKKIFKRKPKPKAKAKAKPKPKPKPKPVVAAQPRPKELPPVFKGAGRGNAPRVINIPGLGPIEMPNAQSGGVEDPPISGDIFNDPPAPIDYKEKIKLINLDKFSQEKSTQEMHKSILLKKYDKLCNYSNALKINKFIDQKKLF